MGRREDLVASASEYVLEHGVIGLTLRPLAAAIDTSDRMLIYHFGTRDELVAALVVHTTDLASDLVEGLPAAPSVRAAVNGLWALYQEQPMRGYMRVYLEAAATGMLSEEPFVKPVREANERWAEAVNDYLVRSGVPEHRGRRLTRLVDSALIGFQLDTVTDPAETLLQGVDDLGQVAQAIADGA